MERPVDRGPIHWNSHGAETGRAPRTYLNALTLGFPPPSALLVHAPPRRARARACVRLALGASAAPLFVLSLLLSRGLALFFPRGFEPSGLRILGNDAGNSKSTILGASL